MSSTAYSHLFAEMSSGPAVLLVGQDLLRQYAGEDLFLLTCERRFGLASAKSYDDLMSNCGDARSVMGIWHDISERIVVPDTLHTLASLPWNCVLTSAIHNVIDRALAADWRTVTPVLDENTTPSDPRNQVKLSLYKLFGCVTRNEDWEQPPCDPFQQMTRNGVALAMLRQLPNLVTPKGLLFVDALATSDWLSPKDLAESIAKLGKWQAHLFGANEEVRAVREIQLLQKMERITLHPDSLGQAINSLDPKQVEVLVASNRSWVEGVEFTFPNKKKHVFTSSQWRRLTNGVTLLTDADARTKYAYASADERYRRFREFLYGPTGVPNWQAHASGLAFRRQEFTDLEAVVLKALGEQRLNDEPILVTGQSGAGKSVALADLAVSVRAKGWPVLFFGRNQTEIDAGLVERIAADLDRLESTSLLLLSDASQMVDQLCALSSYFASRGRKVLVVGSSYERTSEAVCIDFPPLMTHKDATRFHKHLESFEPSLVEGISATDFESRNFWAWLWRLLPESRGRLRLGLLAEVESYSRNLQNSLELNGVLAPPVTGTLGAILAEAGVRTVQSNHSAEINVRNASGEAADQVERLSGLILVPSFYGQDVPIDLVLRCLGREGFEVLRSALNKTPVYRWTEDEYGNQAIGARQQLEAQTIVRSKFSKPEQFEILKTVLRSARSHGDWQRYSFEVDFVLRLLNAVGPSSTIHNPTPDQLLQLAGVIDEVVNSSGSNRNPRLAFQAGYFRREALLRTVTEFNWNDPAQIAQSVPGMIEQYEKAAESLNRAEVAFGAASDQRYRRPLSRVHNEYAALCHLAQEILAKVTKRVPGSPTESLVRASLGTGFDEAIHHCKRSVLFDSENYYSLDVRFKATLHQLTNATHNRKEPLGQSVELIADLCDVLDHDSWRKSPEFYNKRRIELSEVLDDPSMKEDALQTLARMGSTAGEYMLARRCIFDEQRNWRTDAEIDAGLRRIEAIERDVDLRLARLYTQAWWQRYTKLDLYESERRTVALSKSQWEHFGQWLHRQLSFADEDSLKARFLYAWSLFQTGRYRESEDQFRLLDQSAMAGKFRVVRLCLWADECGVAIPCQGTIRRASEDTDKGWVYIPVLRREVTFRPSEFRSQTMLSNEPLEDFHIAFNFRGIIADPIRLVLLSRKE